MNFLVDAQLPRRMAAWLIAVGCDAVHTLDLPDKNRTTDQQLLDLADREQRVIITKDADSVDSHILNARPAKLLLISTGNIRGPDIPPPELLIFKAFSRLCQGLLAIVIWKH